MSIIGQGAELNEATKSTVGRRDIMGKYEKCSRYSLAERALNISFNERI